MIMLHTRPKRTKADARASLNTLLVMAADLDQLTVAQLACTHGLPLPEVASALGAARHRRASQ